MQYDNFGGRVALEISYLLLDSSTKHGGKKYVTLKHSQCIFIAKSSNS